MLSARAGNRDAYNRLYEAHVAAVFGCCLRFTHGDRSQASDLAQEAFASAWSHLADLREPERFSGWLMVIVRRTCLQHVARAKRERDALHTLHAEPRPTAVRATETASIIAEVIAACPDVALREVAELFYREPGHETQAIAERLGVTQSVITTRLYRFRVWAKTRMLGRLADALEQSS